MSTLLTAPVSARQFALFDQNSPLELVRGEIREMPRPGVGHGLVCKNLVVLLDRWAEKTRQYAVICNDAGLQTESAPDTVRGPDVFVFELNAEHQTALEQGYLTTAPLLVAEVLSPFDRWKELVAKLDEYFATGTQEVWVVDPELRQLQVHRATASGPRLFFSTDAYRSEVVNEHEFAVSELFRGLPESR